MAATNCHFCGTAIGGRFSIDGDFFFHPDCLTRIEAIMAENKPTEENATLCPECLNWILGHQPRKSALGLVFHEECAKKAAAHVDDDKDVINIEMPTSFTIEMIELSPNEKTDAQTAMAEAAQLEKAMAIEPPLDGLHKDGWGWYQINGLVIQRRKILQRAFDTVFTANGGGDLFNPS